eukprot:5999420-Alexandrium_andersonii.AAC.1
MIHSLVLEVPPAAGSGSQGPPISSELGPGRRRVRACCALCLRPPAARYGACRPQFEVGDARRQRKCSGRTGSTV